MDTTHSVECKKERIILQNHRKKNGESMCQTHIEELELWQQGQLHKKRQPGDQLIEGRGVCQHMLWWMNLFWMTLQT
eukprot:11304124-Karenia_brevis.AAC.1